MNRLKELRLIKGLRQQDLADYLTVAKSTYSYWENGKIEINNANLFRLAEFHGVTIDYLLGRTDARAMPDGALAGGSLEPWSASDDARALASSYSRLSDGDKALVRSLVDSLAEKSDNMTNPP